MNPHDSPPTEPSPLGPGTRLDTENGQARRAEQPAAPPAASPPPLSPGALRPTPPEPATMPEARPDLGTTETFELAGYDILGEIARGGMGVVYKAWQRSLDRPVALKCLPPSFRDDPDRLARFQSEATAAAKLTKHGIVPVYDVVEAAGAPVLVMPYIEGSDLARILSDRLAVQRDHAPADGKHPWAALPAAEFLERVLTVLDRAIDALMRLHEADVLHRDIKPSNILVDKHGDGWLTDFGLSRFSGHAAAWAGTVGTPGYMSPEQWDDEADVDGRADVFSLGVTAHQALTLELPYARKRITVRTAIPAPPSKRNPLVTERLDAVIAKAIHPDRTQRYQSAAELKEAWERARRKPSEPSGWWRRATRRKRATAVAALAFSLLLLVGGTAWLASLWAGSGGGAGGPEPPHNVIVHITTDPPGATVVFVPLHPDTGEPQGELAVRPPRGQITPLQIELAPGPYFIEAGLGKGRFHQVYRQVPLPGQPSPHAHPHLTWETREDGSVALPIIRIPTANVLDNMARFGGSRNFLMGSKDLGEARPPHVQPVAPFFLGVQEVTEGEYDTARGGLPLELLQPRGESFAVTHVTCDEAVTCAELMGKRLPTEAEYEWAATMGGTQKFPWGDDEKLIRGWPLGVVRQPNYDHTPTEPPVYGLYSNVAEWTSTWHKHYPTTLAVHVLENPGGTRTVRGGPYWLVTGNPTKEKLSWDPRYRYGVSTERAWPGLGFRCARSVQPLFLNR